MEKTTNNGSPADADELKKRSKELATDAGHSLASKANDTGKKGMSALGRKIDEAANAVSEAGMRQAVDPESPLAPHHVSKVTGPMREAAHYLDTRDPRGLLTDIDGAVHRHPYRAIAIGVATGWVVGKLFRSR